MYPHHHDMSLVDWSGIAKDNNTWRWGFMPQSESWNGRFAMLGFVAALLLEYLSDRGVLHFYNLVQTFSPIVK